MRHQNSTQNKLLKQQAKHYNGVAKARTRNSITLASKRVRASGRNECLPFAPPEDWYEPTNSSKKYRIVCQPAGEGYRHVVTPDEVRHRLAQLPERLLESLEVVQLSRMTRKKSCFPCYGMQWGSTLYLYPLETSLEEVFYTPPRPDLVNETKMYGGRWVHQAPGTWRLIWTKQTIKDFYLNNILIHELGHLLDDRNASYTDRERYAEWFAIRYGYLPSRKKRESGQRKKVIRRRHHAKS